MLFGQKFEDYVTMNFFFIFYFLFFDISWNKLIDYENNHPSS